MKLPSITQGAAQKLAPTDIGAAFAEHQSRMQIVKSAGIAVDQVGDAFLRYEERETKRQIQEGSLGIQQRLVEAEQRYGSKQEFNLMDEEAANDPRLAEILEMSGITDVDKSIPAYRLKPELMARAYDDAIEEFASGISNRAAREQFEFDHKTARMNVYLKNTAQASKDQIEYVNNQTDAAVENALEKMDYSTALMAVKESQYPEAEKKEKTEEIYRRVQTDYFNNTLKQRDIDEMQRALDELLDDESSGSRYLSEQEEKVYANQLRTAIGQEMNKVQGTTKAALAQLKDDANIIISELESGGAVEPQLYTQTLQALSLVDPVKARDMEVAYEINGQIASINQRPASDMIDFLSNPHSPHASTEEIEVFQKLEKQAKQNLQDIKADTMGFMIEKGVSNVTPIDFGSSAGFAETLKARVGSYQLAQDMYGYSSGYLSDNEVYQFNDMLNRAKDTSTRLGIFSSVQSALGDKAGRFYEQLKNKGIGGADMMAGQLFSDGNQQDAFMVVEGGNLLKSDTGKDLVTKNTRDAIESVVRSEFGNAFFGNPTQRELMKEAVTAAYAKLAYDKSDFGSTDNKRVRQAINIATGGLADFNGSMIQLPNSKMSEREFNNWMEELHPSNYDGMNVYQTPEEVKDLIDSGEWKLRGVGRGKYTIVDNQGKIIGSKTNQSVPFVLEYDFKARKDYESAGEMTEYEIERNRRRADRDEGIRNSWFNLGTPKEQFRRP